ncbi:methyltransferase domain-containing protein [Stutzerimonas azotifigens]|uniref:methyltransferase domain-containing protein n=1 Tax=Stutzerimonas azotifigens TaxID=291995 RepID=UPI00126860E4|nr:methyltransferase domain-containing protein [Stutzerimonas azotifigens]
MIYRRRIDYLGARSSAILDFCRDKVVFHFGAADWPDTLGKGAKGNLLHQKLSEISSKLYGADLEPAGVQWLAQNGYEVSRIDICRDDFHLPSDVQVVIFGEIIEHLDDVGAALWRLHKGMPDAAKIVTTTPNAFYGQNFFNGVMGVENQHPDHVCLFSPVTLVSSFERAGFKCEQLATCKLDRGGKGKISQRFWSAAASFFPSLGETIYAVFSKK